MPVAEMAYLPDERRFVLVLNRFRWEPKEDGERDNHQRTLTGLCIDGVARVQRRGFSPSDGERILVLLALRAEGEIIYLDFAGGGAIRLESGGRMPSRGSGRGLADAWRPQHEVAEKE